MLHERYKKIPPEERKKYAQEVIDVYAPLANRLGIGQFKWELEDLSFRYLEQEKYKSIASFLAERPRAREERIHRIIHSLHALLSAEHISAVITGRPKTIYSFLS